MNCLGSSLLLIGGFLSNCFNVLPAYPIITYNHTMQGYRQLHVNETAIDNNCISPYNLIHKQRHFLGSDYVDNSYNCNLFTP
jgi:hypothetical protein